MPRDIDEITRRVARQFFAVHVEQLKVTHPADDDGIWYFSLPEGGAELHVESSRGCCPFLIETNETGTHEAFETHTIEQTTLVITHWLAAQSRGEPVWFRQTDFPK